MPFHNVTLNADKPFYGNDDSIVFNCKDGTVYTIAVMFWVVARTYFGTDNKIGLIKHFRSGLILGNGNYNTDDPSPNIMGLRNAKDIVEWFLASGL